MSSESDSEFQSADEEEFDQASCKTTETVEKESPQEQHENSTVKEQNSHTTTRNSEGNVIRHPQPNSSLPELEIEQKLEDISIQSELENNPSETTATANQKTPETINKDSEGKSSLRNILDESKDDKLTKDEEPQKQRVMLRLEKKKMEKAESKECTREKPSDLINLLEDLNSQKQSSWGFSSWGSSILSTAASSVSTFSEQVSQGLGAVLDTVESTLGAPSPEELANNLKQEKDEGSNSSEEVTSRADSASGIIPDLSGWTKAFENTSSKMILGGLDTLELIGKKTMDILTEGDPGLRKKRSAFEGVNLSEILREAKSKADEADRENAEDESVHYSQIFDEKQGLVHLEALEILSQENQAKLQRLMSRHSKSQEVKKRLEEIRVICENIPSLDDSTDCENFDDFETVLKKHCMEISLPLNADNIIKVQRQINESLTKYEKDETSQFCPKDIFQAAICSLAEFTAKCIETFHKVGELALVQPDIDRDLELCTTNLTGLTTVMCIEVNIMSSRFHKCLESAVESVEHKSDADSTMAVNLFVEAANSNKYIQDAFKMLVPLLQTRLLETIE